MPRKSKNQTSSSRKRAALAARGKKTLVPQSSFKSDSLRQSLPRYFQKGPTRIDASGNVTSVFDTLTTGFKFIGKGLSDMGAQVTFPLMAIGRPSNLSDATSRMSDMTNYLSTAFLNVADYSGYLSPTISKLFEIFTKWIPIDFEFVYTPQCPTTMKDSLAFAYNVDPISQSLAQAGGLTTGQQFEKLLCNKYSGTFAPWEAWSMKVPYQEEMRGANSSLYTTWQNSSGGATDISTVSYRTVYSGGFALRSEYSSNSTYYAPDTGFQKYGMLWMRMTVKFVDVAAVFLTGLFSQSDPLLLNGDALGYPEGGGPEVFYIDGVPYVADYAGNPVPYTDAIERKLVTRIRSSLGCSQPYALSVLRGLIADRKTHIPATPPLPVALDVIERLALGDSESPVYVEKTQDSVSSRTCLSHSLSLPSEAGAIGASDPPRLTRSGPAAVATPSMSRTRAT